MSRKRLYAAMREASFRCRRQHGSKYGRRISALEAPSTRTPISQRVLIYQAHFSAASSGSRRHQCDDVSACRIRQSGIVFLIGVPPFEIRAILIYRCRAVAERAIISAHHLHTFATAFELLAAFLATPHYSFNGILTSLVKIFLTLWRRRA